MEPYRVQKVPTCAMGACRSPPHHGELNKILPILADQKLYTILLECDRAVMADELTESKKKQCAEASLIVGPK